MSIENNSRANAEREKFLEETDYYFENGLMVLTAHFLKKRGYCCGNGCRHCPYGDTKKDELQEKSV